jgi:hypothetical protein
VTSIKVKVQRKAQIKVKVIPVFPSSVGASEFITVDKANGAYTIGIDYNLIGIGAPTSLSTSYAMVLDQDQSAYKMVPLSSFGGGGTSGREVLTADRTYYVRTNGSDSNDGKANTAGGAFLTIPKAISAVIALDLSIYNVTIQVAAGTYTAGALVNAPWVGAGTVTLIGDATTPTNVIISTTSADAISATGFGARLTVKGFKVQTTTSGVGISAYNGGFVTVSDKMDFGATAGEHVRTQTAGIVRMSSISYTVSGSPAGGNHLSASPNGTIICNSSTMTLTANITVSDAFVRADRQSFMNAFNMTFTLGAFAVTGKRFTVETGSVLFVNGASITYFPGSVAGTGTTYAASPYGLYF